jgi:aryl-alcohol dehydrogenase-like predicted oxidoreductase
VDWDWRSGGKAFGLPLFEADNFAKELRVAERLKELAADHGKSSPQMAIAWVLGNPAVSVALVGIRNKQELQENVAAADWRLTDEIRCEIDRVFEEEGVPMYVGAEQAA